MGKRKIKTGLSKTRVGLPRLTGYTRLTGLPPLTSGLYNRSIRVIWTHVPYVSYSTGRKMSLVIQLPTDYAGR